MMLDVGKNSLQYPCKYFNYHCAVVVCSLKPTGPMSIPVVLLKWLPCIIIKIKLPSYNFHVMKGDCQVGIWKRKDVKAPSLKVIIIAKSIRLGFMRYDDKEQKQQLVEIALK